MTDFINDSEMHDYRSKLKELLNEEDGLTDWEISFLDNLMDWDGSFTIAQASTLDKIYERIL